MTLRAPGQYNAECHVRMGNCRPPPAAHFS